MKKNSDTNNRPKGRQGTDQSGQAADQTVKADVATGASEERTPVVWEDGKCSW